METLINKYIESKKFAWSPNTLKSEQSRLISIKELLALEPLQLYLALEVKYKKYTLNITYIRVSELHAFNGNNLYKEFMRTNARLFKNAKVKKQVPITFEEAQKRIEGLEDVEIKQLATLMLTTGLRIHEARKYDGSGEVIGKGLKKRTVFSNIKITNAPSYTTIHRALRKIGLAPHDLRKLAATKLADSGMRNVDLMEVMGWTSMETAASYLQTSTKKQLEEQVKQILQGE
jgi:integrase